MDIDTEQQGRGCYRMKLKSHIIRSTYAAEGRYTHHRLEECQDSRRFLPSLNNTLSGLHSTRPTY